MGFNFVIRYIKEECDAKKIPFHKVNTNEYNKREREQGK